MNRSTNNVPDGIFEMIANEKRQQNLTIKTLSIAVYKEVVFYPSSVSLFVCLFVCLSISNFT